MNPELGPKAIAALVTAGLVLVSMMVLYDSNTPAGSAVRTAVKQVGRHVRNTVLGFIPALGMGVVWMVAAPFRSAGYRGRHYA